ncbi:MAG: ankyrin repeat domain-containing protein [Chitinophagaceae bacterium]
MQLSPLPLHALPAQYDQQAAAWLVACTDGDAGALHALRDNHPRFCQLTDEQLRQLSLAQQDIQEALLRFYCFKTWEELMGWVVEMLDKRSSLMQFEMAANAIVSGNLEELDALLSRYPELVHMRSLRSHHAMLLHYTAANGVEQYRQHTPANITAIVKRLVKAGADVNAEADLYGGGATTLGLAATSVWPSKAGVMAALLETLLEAGAAIESPRAAGNGQLAVNGCLHNGRPEAADFLMRKGAGLDLEAAAGTGRLDVVQAFFNKDGSLKDAGMQRQLEPGFTWACAYGHEAVVRFLLDQGFDPATRVDELYGLHWALLGAHANVIRLLLSRGAPLETRNAYGGTALGAALWAVANGHEVNRWPETGTDYIAIIEILLQAGAVIEPGMLEWIAGENGISSDMKERLGMLMRRYMSRGE